MKKWVVAFAVVVGCGIALRWFWTEEKVQAIDEIAVTLPAARMGGDGTTVEMTPKAESSVSVSYGGQARLSTCVLRADADEQVRQQFLARNNHLGLRDEELLDLISAIREDGLSDELIADYDAVVTDVGHHSYQLDFSQAENKPSEAQLQAMKTANLALSATYIVSSPDSYAFSQPAFTAALEQLVESYRDYPTEGAMLLYLHMRAAQQQYWRYAPDADWRQWVHFEHHRQALIWVIERYGDPEQIHRIHRDRHLISTVNRYSGELDRGFGPVLAEPVYEKIDFYKSSLRLDESDANAEPINYSKHSKSVSFQQAEEGALKRVSTALWPDGAGRSLSDFFDAMAKDCQE